MLNFLNHYLDPGDSQNWRNHSDAAVAAVCGVVCFIAGLVVSGVVCGLLIRKRKAIDDLEKKNGDTKSSLVNAVVKVIKVRNISLMPLTKMSDLLNADGATVVVNLKEWLFCSSSITMFSFLTNFVYTFS